MLTRSILVPRVLDPIMIIKKVLPRIRFVIEDKYCYFFYSASEFLQLRKMLVPTLVIVVVGVVTE